MPSFPPLPRNPPLALLLIASASRVALLLLAVAANFLIPDHRAEGVRIFEWPASASPLLQTFTRWDAAHFLSIARDGYTDVPSHAFFPLLPLAIRRLAGLLHPSSSEHPSPELLVACGLLITNACFIWAVLSLYHLSLAVVKDRRLSYLSSLSLVLSPASVFFTTVYTEAPYTALSTTAFALWQHHRGSSVRRLLALPFFSLATSCRSNGIANTLPLVVDFLAECHALLGGGGEEGSGGTGRTTRRKKDDGRAGSNATAAASRGRGTGLSGVPWSALLITALTYLLAAVAVLWPYVAFQYYGYIRFCSGGGGMAEEADLQWCHDTWPNLYGFVQRRYWGVGLLRYYQWKQLPNFLLAAPVLLLTLLGLRDYYTLNVTRPSAYATPATLGFQVQWACLAMVALLTANVQITTRLLSCSTPALYWYIAHLWQAGSRRRRLLLWYAGGYAVLGTILHANFLPWT